MNLLYPTLGYVVLARVIELLHARRNTRRLRAAGAIEVGGRHYPLFFLLHGSWIAAMAFLLPAAVPANPFLLGLFALLQIARLWTIASLGRFWTTRILVEPGRVPVRRGPYRFLRHPNYLIVTAEIAVLPLAFGGFGIALAWSILNVVLLRHRVALEEHALGAR